MLLRYDDTEVLQFFKSAINEVLDQDFSAKYSIISQGTDKYAEMLSLIHIYQSLVHKSWRHGIGLKCNFWRCAKSTMRFGVVTFM